MKILIACYLWSWIAFGAPEAFRIEFRDRSVKISAPAEGRKQFAVTINNLSLSDLYAKFRVGEKDLKFISVKAGLSHTVEFTSPSTSTVYFIPLSPAFQNVPLEFGKNNYEIPRPR
jgi:hypothetical protein